MAAICAGCGLAVAGGTEECQALFEQLSVREYEVFGAGRHRLVVDSYCLQHPERYCVSAKSLAAHLMGLCWAIEYGGHPSGLRAQQRWLSSNPSLEKPPLPVCRGALTVADVLGATDADAFAAAVDRWARSTWEAYASLQPLARQWIARAWTGR